MTTLEDFKQQVISLLADFNCPAALLAIENFKPTTPLEQRCQEHFMGKTYLMMGAYRKAKSLLLNCEQQFGENIGITLDLAVCYYHLSEIDLWRETYQILQKKLESLHGQLSLSAEHDVRVLIGKFLEEDARIDQAFQLYENALQDYRNNKKEKDAMYFEYICQLTRLNAMFYKVDVLGPLYTELLSLNLKKFSKSLAFEIEHALMLAEVNLVGSDHAWERVQHALQDMNVQLNDKRLIFFDFIEEQLIRKKIVPQERLNFFDQALPENHEEEWLFEDEVYSLAFDHKRKRSLMEVSRMAAVLPLSSYIRLLILHLSQEKSSEHIQELKNKINLLLGSLEPQSRIYWQNRMKPFMQLQDLVLKFSSQSRTISFQNKSLDLSRKKSMVNLLTLLSQNSPLPVDDAIHSLWESSFTPEHYHRLRMTAHRLNQLLFTLTANPKVIEISADAITLNGPIALNSTDLNK